MPVSTASVRAIRHWTRADRSARRSICEVWTSVAVAMALGVPAAGAQGFTDDFESPDISPFWSVSQGPVPVVLSSTFAHSGSQSVAIGARNGFDSGGGIWHSFSYHAKGTASVWIYDTAPNQQTRYCGLTVYNTSIRYGDPGSNMGAGIMDWGPSFYYVIDASRGEGVSSGIPRSEGWHHFEIVIDDDSVDYRIDGQPVGSFAGDYQFNTVNLEVFGPSWRPSATYYFDDFAIEARGEAPQGKWVHVRDSGPVARAAHAMVYDAARGVVLLHGGSALGAFLTDTWSWNGSAWTLEATRGPAPARADSGLAYDADHDRVVLFGGELDLPCTNGDRFLGDTWTWDGSQWSLATTAGPPARSSMAMSYDSARARAVLFGGLNDCGAGLADTWEWDGVQWTDSGASQPGSHRQPKAWFDAVTGRVRVFGGYNGAYLNDMWEWTGSVWNPIAQTGPGGRQAHALAYDEVSGQVVLVGGNDAGGTLWDMWVFDGEAWTEITGCGPVPRSGHAMAYDALRDQIVLFGGRAQDGSFLNDTWIWTKTDARGNLNCDCALDAFDIEPFVLALTDPSGYAAAYPDCDRNLADINGDGAVDAFDIEPFIQLLVGP